MILLDIVEFNIAKRELRSSEIGKHIIPASLKIKRSSKSLTEKLPELTLVQLIPLVK